MHYRFVCISIYIHCPRDAPLVRGECFVMLQKLGNFGEQVCFRQLVLFYAPKSGDFGEREKKWWVTIFMFRRNIRFVDYEYLMILSAVGAEGLLAKVSVRRRRITEYLLLSLFYFLPIRSKGMKNKTLNFHFYQV